MFRRPLSLFLVTSETSSRVLHFSSAKFDTHGIEAKISRLDHALDVLKPRQAEFDFDGHEYNGVRTFVEMVKRFLKLTSKNIKNSKQTKRIANVADLLLIEFDLVVDTIGPKAMSKMDIYDKMMEATEEQYLSLVELGYFYLPPELANIAQFAGIGGPIGHRRYTELVRAVFKRSLRQQYQAAMAMSGNATCLQNALAAADIPLLNIPVFDSRAKCIINYVPMASDQKYVIGIDGEIVKAHGMIKKQVVNTLIVKNKDVEEKFARVLVFYCHGGATVARLQVPSRVLLSRLAIQMPGATIVCPDYSISPQHTYPRQLQEILDAFLQLQASGKFDKVIVAGQSTGGNFALSLLKALARLGHDPPDHLVLESPCATHSFLRMPSRSLCLTDAFIHRAMMMSAFDSYAPCDGVVECEHRRPLPPPEARPWYLQDRDSVAQRIKIIEDTADRDELFNPLVGGLDSLARTSLLINAAKHDPLLDDSIVIAKAWPSKEKVQFVGTDLCHAYPLFPTASCSEQFDKLIAKIKELV